MYQPEIEDISDSDSLMEIEEFLTPSELNLYFAQGQPPKDIFDESPPQSVTADNCSLTCESTESPTCTAAAQFIKDHAACGNTVRNDRNRTWPAAETDQVFVDQNVYTIKDSNGQVTVFNLNSYEGRMSTFKGNWSPLMVFSPEFLVSLGFYFKDFPDVVQCCVCQTILSEIHPALDILMMHYYLSKLWCGTPCSVVKDLVEQTPPVTLAVVDTKSLYYNNFDTTTPSTVYTTAPSNQQAETCQLTGLNTALQDGSVPMTPTLDPAHRSVGVGDLYPATTCAPVVTLAPSPVPPIAPVLEGTDHSNCHRIHPDPRGKGSVASLELGQGICDLIGTVLKDRSRNFDFSRCRGFAFDAAHDEVKNELKELELNCNIRKAFRPLLRLIVLFVDKLITSLSVFVSKTIFHVIGVISMLK